MTEQKRRLSKRHTQCLADDMGMPMEVDIETIIADYVARHVKTEAEGEPEAKRQRVFS